MDLEYMLDFAKRQKKLYIYGAGEIGRLAAGYLIEKDVDINGFIVTRPIYEKKVVLGIPVISKSDINAGDKIGIIIAMNSSYAAEVEDSVKSCTKEYMKVNETLKKDIIDSLMFDREINPEKNITVFVYHRVGELDIDTRNLSVKSDRFQEQLKWIKSNYHILRSDEDWTTKEKAAVITFDDGYHDFFEIVVPILERYKVPATVFISTGNVDKTEEFWTDFLERIIFFSYSGFDKLEFCSKKFDIDDYNGRLETFFYIRNILKDMSMVERNEKLSELAAEAPLKVAPRVSHRVMTSEEIKECSKSEFVTIGAHTVSHCCLAAEDETTQRNEIYESKNFLENITGKDVNVFAYPYGGREDFNEKTIAICEEAGFKKIFAAYPGFTGYKVQTCKIPRINISMCASLKELSDTNKLLRLLYTDETV